MKILMTGLHGTVAPVVATYLSIHSHIVIPFDRDLIDTENKEKVTSFIKEVSPDFIFHLGMSSIEFTKLLVETSKRLGIIFLFTSTVMVFDGNEIGPYETNVIPKPKSEYGMYKYQCEKAILEIDKDAYIIRLGWQIGDHTSGNQMISHLKKEYLEKGYNEASKDVFLACSFITESAKAILDIIHMKPDIYHIDQSKDMSYYDVICYLKTIHPWITPKLISSEKYNNQLIDKKMVTKKLF
jgi:dTDP-4-dehydrorhamnose reductase